MPSNLNSPDLILSELNWTGSAVRSDEMR